MTAEHALLSVPSAGVGGAFGALSKPLPWLRARRLLQRCGLPQVSRYDSQAMEGNGDELGEICKVCLQFFSDGIHSGRCGGWVFSSHISAHPPPQPVLANADG